MAMMQWTVKEAVFLGRGLKASPFKVIEMKGKQICVGSVIVAESTENYYSQNLDCGAHSDRYL